MKGGGVWKREIVHRELGWNIQRPWDKRANTISEELKEGHGGYPVAYLFVVTHQEKMQLCSIHSAQEKSQVWN